MTIKLLQIFRKQHTCAAELVHKLLGTPRMKEENQKEAVAGGPSYGSGIDLQKKIKLRPKQTIPIACNTPKDRILEEAPWSNTIEKNFMKRSGRSRC